MLNDCTLWVRAALLGTTLGCCGASVPERQEKNTAPVANPVAVGRDAALEDVELVPFGATCLRLACFPLANSFL